MKTVELNIDATPNASQITALLKQHNLGKGDELIINSAKLNDEDFIRITVMVVVIAAIAMLQNKKKQIADEIIKSAFAGKSADEIEKEFEEASGIKITFGEQQNKAPVKKKRKLGGFEGRVNLPDNFNEPMEEFKDYF